MLADGDCLVGAALGISQVILLLMQFQRLDQIIELVPKLIDFFRIRVMLQLQLIVVLNQLFELVFQIPTL